MARDATARSDLATAARGVLVAATCAVLVAVLVGVAGTLGAGLARPGARALEDAVALACVVVGAGAFGVIGAGCLLAAVAAGARACGRSFARLEAVAARLVPAALRRTIAVGVTAGLVAALAGPATAAEPDAQGSGADPRAAADVAAFDLGWQVTSAVSVHLPATPSAGAGADADGAQVPRISPPSVAPGTGAAADGATDRSTIAQPTPAAPAAPTAPDPTTPAVPTTAVPTAAAPPTEAQPTETQPTGTQPPGAPATGTPLSVTVHAGDSLWSIAAAHLPPGSDDAAVAAAWPRWYATNRSVVGDDPDLIRPGQILTVPAGDPA